MKKSIFLLLLLSTLLCISCSKEEDSSKLSIDQTEFSVDWQQTVETINIKAENTKWQVSSQADWVTVTPTSGIVGVAVKVSIAANSSYEARSTQLLVTGEGVETQIVTINQKAKHMPVNIVETSTKFVAEGGRKTINVRSNDSWTFSNLPDWITLSPAEGKDTMQVYVYTTENNEEIDRSATIYVTDSYGDKDSITIVQYIHDIDTDLEAVDLGLPSGTLWANMNIGATSIDDYGPSYKWGEVSGVDYSHITETYSYGGKMVLDLEDDTAHSLLGGSWRIPSFEEFCELCKYTKGTWISINGKEGWKLEADNGNWIFLPISGAHESWGRLLLNTLGQRYYELGMQTGVMVMVYGWLPKEWYGYGDYYVLDIEVNDGFYAEPIRAVKSK